MSELSFREVEYGHGAGSRIKNSEPIIIVDFDTWQNDWNRIHGIGGARGGLRLAEPPAVDFNKETVVVVFRGECSSSGYGIKVIHVVENAHTISVRVKKTGEGGTATVMTYPYQIIAIAIPFGTKPINVELIRSVK
ncbi:MAG: protease complex subunit PrcB family protein [Parcubacteria group bacterium]|nr:protease complex subunit PrcB family protein [Parcubacteria group bacterium]